MAYDNSLTALVDDLLMIRDDASLETLKAPFTPKHRGDAKTIGEAAEFLLKDRTHSTREGGVVAWNVKAYAYSSDGHNDEFKNDPALDKAWRQFFEKNDYVYSNAIEQAQEHYRDEWCSYPGEDQGDWKFFFGGRSGGWLCLESWRDYKICDMDSTTYREFIASLVDDALNGQPEALQAFYNGIHTADVEFTNAAANENVAYYIADARQRWEESRKLVKDNVRGALALAIKGLQKDFGYTVDEASLAGALSVAAFNIAGCLK